MNENHYFLPAEWAEQAAVMLTWPHQKTDWAPLLDKIEPTFVAISAAICRFQELIIVADNPKLKQHIEQLLTQAQLNLTKVHFIVTPTDDTWARDHGPITVLPVSSLKQLQTKLLNFTFNGWGNKFNASKDNAINQALFEQLKQDNWLTAALETVDFVLEGGAIESDGAGHLLTTRQCLLNPNRNPAFNQEQIATQLSQWFNCEKVLWLEHGELEGDDTDAHIDTLCRFAPNNTLVYVQCDQPDDCHYQELQLMEDELQQLTNKDGKPFNLVPLPWPSAKYNDDGERLPATYANYLIINNAVLVPTYQDSQDQRALRQIAKAYPGREIIAIDCLAIIEQYGSLHCLTMQLPKQVTFSSMQ